MIYLNISHELCLEVERFWPFTAGKHEGHGPKFDAQSSRSQSYGTSDVHFINTETGRCGMNFFIASLFLSKGWLFFPTAFKILKDVSSNIHSSFLLDRFSSSHCLHWPWQYVISHFSIILAPISSCPSKIVNVEIYPFRSVFLIYFFFRNSLQELIDTYVSSIFRISCFFFLLWSTLRKLVSFNDFDCTKK